MKRMFPLLLLVLGYGSGRLCAQVVSSFNFSLAPRHVDGWINLAGEPSAAVITATDPATGITVSSIGTGNWASYTGICAGDGVGDYPGTFFPAQVMSNQWAQYNNPLAGYNALLPQLKISGLSQDSVYYIRMSSSFIYGWNCNPVQYTVAGKTVAPSEYLNASYNKTMGVTFKRIAPDTNREIRVYVNTTAATNMADISGLQIISGSATVNIPTVAITSPADNNILPEESTITISATASEAGGSITKVEFYADTTKIGEATTPPYKVIWNNPNEGHYLLTAKATDANGTTNIATIHIGIESLTSFWSMTGNIAMNADSNFVGNVDSVRLAFRTKNMERMSIAPNGQVGIGTINPTAQLHTTGTVRLAGLTSDSTKNRVLVSDSSGNLFYRNVSSLSNRWQYAGGVLYDSADNIGIGTNDTKGYKLAVNGTAIFTKVRVKTAGTWPDYVFKQGYALPDLGELERFVREHKHLPGIVSEQEVARNGIDVGDHQAALLQKVEELTLYLIEEHKRLKEQEQAMKLLQEQTQQLQQQNQQLQQQNQELQKQQQEIDELKRRIGAKK